MAGSSHGHFQVVFWHRVISKRFPIDVRHIANTFGRAWNGRLSPGPCAGDGRAGFTRAGFMREERS
ncbi:hypothetical protein C3920_12305 [Novacetimonas pomaceti]|uniref:Uncharacterized protein n=1 Tax=Novacetimonas pomaceti TaxID=2021998 RepID=A0ABX5NZS3_9PROT|nr:hypothetical protein C3920_12305 [Novacetimonas pomaceti]